MKENNLADDVLALAVSVSVIHKFSLNFPIVILVKDLISISHFLSQQMEDFLQPHEPSRVITSQIEPNVANSLHMDHIMAAMFLQRPNQHSFWGGLMSDQAILAV